MGLQSPGRGKAANGMVRNVFSVQPSLAAKSRWRGRMGSLAFLLSVGGLKELSSSAGSWCAAGSQPWSGGAGNSGDGPLRADNGEAYLQKKKSF